MDPVKGNSSFTPEQIEHRRKIDGGQVWVGKFSGVGGRGWDGKQSEENSRRPRVAQRVLKLSESGRNLTYRRNKSHNANAKTLWRQEAPEEVRIFWQVHRVHLVFGRMGCMSVLADIESMIMRGESREFANWWTSPSQRWEFSNQLYKYYIATFE